VLAEAVRRGLEPVLVGRDPARLSAAARECGVPQAERRVAALEEVAGALRGCAAVINCAGPFTTLGPPVVRAAVEAGCHYVDTAGEQGFVAWMFDAVTETGGVTLVPGANDGCLPVDLLARLLVGGRAVETVTTAHFLSGGGGLSRGSRRSLEVSAGRPTLPQDVPTPEGLLAFPVCEMVTIPRHTRVARTGGFVDAALVGRLGAAPRDTDGPTPVQRRGQRFRYTVHADGARGVVEGTDTYGTTAVVAVEAVRRLLRDGAPAGVLAAAQAFDPVDLLAAAGLTWRV
jgi:short subunit dehydrogenase-like uncharacterized protein